MRSRIANLILQNILFIEENFPEKDTLPYKCYLEEPASIPSGTQCVPCLLPEYGCLPGQWRGGQSWDQVCQVYCSEERVHPKKTPNAPAKKEYKGWTDAKNNKKNVFYYLSIYFLIMIICLLLFIMLLCACAICGIKCPLEFCGQFFLNVISNSKCYYFAILCFLILLFIALSIVYIFREMRIIWDKGSQLYGSQRVTFYGS